MAMAFIGGKRLFLFHLACTHLFLDKYLRHEISRLSSSTRKETFFRTQISYSARLS